MTTPEMPADIPDMVLVPREPTPDMCIAGGIAMCEARETAETSVDEASACWSAMLSASPLGASGEGALRPASRSSVPTEQAGGPVVGVSPLEIAYGCLWREVTADPSLHGARQYIANLIGPEGKLRGVQWAAANLSPPTDAEIRSIEA